MEGILAHHADDIIMFDVPPPFQSAVIAAYRDTWQTFFKYTKPGVFNFHSLNVIAGEDLALAVATMWCEDNSDGKGFQHLDFRLTIGLRKIEGRWLIVHEHHSVPAE